MNRPRSPAPLLLALILLLAAGLRIFNLPALGFWTDEFCSLSEANGWGLAVSRLPGVGVIQPGPRYTRLIDARPISRIFTEISHDDAHPPLYFLLLRGWENLFGDGESAVRSLNVLFSLASIALLYAAVRQQHPPSVALPACLLMAVANPQIQFAQEARNYMPLVTCSLLAAFFLLRLQKSGANPFRVAGLFFSVLIMLFMHYFALPIAAAMGLYALTSMRAKERTAAAGAIVAAGLVFAVTWGPMMFRQLPIFSAGHQWLAEPGSHSLSRTLILLEELPGRFIFETDDSPVFHAIAVASGLMWLALLPAFFSPGQRLWAIWLTFVVGMVATTDILQSTGQLKFIRFTLAATPPAYVMLASLPLGRWRVVPPLAATVLALIALHGWAYFPPWKLDFRTPAQAIADRIQDDDALVFVGSDPVTLALTYNGFRHYLHPPNTLVLLDQPADAAVLARLRTARQIWVVDLPQKRPIDQMLPGFVSLEPPGRVPFFVDLYRGTLTAR